MLSIFNILTLHWCNPMNSFSVYQVAVELPEGTGIKANRVIGGQLGLRRTEDLPEEASGDRIEQDRSFTLTRRST